MNEIPDSFSCRTWEKAFFGPYLPESVRRLVCCLLLFVTGLFFLACLSRSVRTRSASLLHGPVEACGERGASLAREEVMAGWLCTTASSGSLFVLSPLSAREWKGRGGRWTLHVRVLVLV